MFFTAGLERAVTFSKTAVYCFLISLLVPELQYESLKKGSLRLRSARKSH